VFGFIYRDGATGTGSNTLLKFDGNNAMYLTYPSDYSGKPFVVIKDGVTYRGTLATERNIISSSSTSTYNKNLLTHEIVDLTDPLNNYYFGELEGLNITSQEPCVLIFNHTSDLGIGFIMNLYLGSDSIAVVTVPNSYAGSQFDLIYEYIRYTGTFSSGDVTIVPLDI
jgi:hypothetical protein